MPLIIHTTSISRSKNTARGSGRALSYQHHTVVLQLDKSLCQRWVLLMRIWFMTTKNGKQTIHQPIFCYFVGFLVVVKTLSLCFCSKREREVAWIITGLNTKKSPHYCEVDRQIFTSPRYGEVDWQICLSFFLKVRSAFPLDKSLFCSLLYTLYRGTGSVDWGDTLCSQVAQCSVEEAASRYVQKQCNEWNLAKLTFLLNLNVH